MRALLCSLVLAFTQASTSPQESKGTFFAPEDDMGTLPLNVQWAYVVVMEPDAHGVRVHRRLNRTTELVIEYLDLGELLSPYGAPFQGVSGAITMSEPLARDLFTAGVWVEMPGVEPESGCVSAPCAASNSICSGWCQPGPDIFEWTWMCLCTEYRFDESSGNTLARHRRRVLQAKAVEVQAPYQDEEELNAK